MKIRSGFVSNSSSSSFVVIAKPIDTKNIQRAKNPAMICWDYEVYGEGYCYMEIDKGSEIHKFIMTNDINGSCEFYDVIKDGEDSILIDEETVLEPGTRVLYVQASYHYPETLRDFIETFGHC